MAHVAIGLIGHYPFIRGHPLGAAFKERLDDIDWAPHDVTLKEMNWGPIAIVQDFQATGEVYDRIVLVGAVDRGLENGTVTCRQWIGGKLDVMGVQQRIFEAVTGIVSLDNLLVIGAHFGIWPRELITVEIQLSANSVGELILEELERHAGSTAPSIIGQDPPSPEVQRIVERTVHQIRQAATRGVAGMTTLQTLSAHQLGPLADVCHNQLIVDCVERTSPN
ncbi:MAG: hypothetical protein ACR2HE_07250 [Casimicrobiaceae bacterium]